MDNLNFIPIRNAYFGLELQICTESGEVITSNTSLPSQIEHPSTSEPSEHLQNETRALSNGAAGHQVRKVLMDEIKALGDNAKKVDAAFERVRIGLGQIDAKEYIGKDGKPVRKFQGEWAEYQKCWRDLIQKSRDFATAAEVLLVDFVQVVIPVVEDIKSADPNDVKDAKWSLDAFLKDCTSHGENIQGTKDSAVNYSEGFADLCRRLEEFKGMFDEFANQHKNTPDAPDIKTQEELIQDLKAQVRQYQWKVGSAAVAAIISGVGDGWVGCGHPIPTIGVSAACAVGPYVTFTIMLAGCFIALGLGYIGLVQYNKLSAVKNRLQDAEDELRRMRQHLDQLSQLQAALDDQKTDIEAICSCLKQFSEIWSIVAHDAQFIRGALDNASRDAGCRKALLKRVSLLKNSYTILADALRLYSTQTNISTA
ncbi:hypothetical protein NP233_g6331 [Leucocoprinus birnbaumii]|uniref:Uncharacterized protein n=1 Tax=Leucocoprinus birnbaumii TaxID=56174 RepID=A0AAD5VRC7_9AGAR|nr:hypothetical protein NP233_g6331 [Leucocoprinus birnbaumii]